MFNLLYKFNIKFKKINFPKYSKSPLGDCSNENIHYHFPGWRSEQVQNTQPSVSEDAQMSYFSSSKIVPIPGLKKFKQYFFCRDTAFKKYF